MTGEKKLQVHGFNDLIDLFFFNIYISTISILPFIKAWQMSLLPLFKNSDFTIIVLIILTIPMTTIINTNTNNNINE